MLRYREISSAVLWVDNDKNNDNDTDRSLVMPKAPSELNETGGTENTRKAFGSSEGVTFPQTRVTQTYSLHRHRSYINGATVNYERNPSGGTQMGPELVHVEGLVLKSLQGWQIYFIGTKMSYSNGALITRN